MSRFLYGAAMVSSFLGYAVLFVTFFFGAMSAIQQAALAAGVLGFVMLPFIAARSIDARTKPPLPPARPWD